MLVLPAFGVIEAHVAHRLAGAVGVADVDGEVHHPVGGQYPRTVALGALHEVLAEVHDTTAAQEVREILHRGEVCEGKDGHGSIQFPLAFISSTSRSRASSCGMLRSTTSRPL